MSKTRCRFDSLYFGIYLEFDFCDLRFKGFLTGIVEKIPSTKLQITNKIQIPIPNVQNTLQI